ncbi:MAG: hypothetical protein JWR16_133 [Nevskia sp.]|nr:hypothetical protein [Nevskia sp.]
MPKVNLRSSVVALSLSLIPCAAFAYSATGSFPGAEDGPKVASDYGQSLDFGFSAASDPSSFGLRPVSGQGAALSDDRSLERPAAQRQGRQMRQQQDEFNRDFYGLR